MSLELADWSAHSWKNAPVREQNIEYQNENHLSEVLEQLAKLPSLVSQSSIDAARAQYAAASRGEAFILIGGDCAENFSDIKTDIIAQKVRLLASQAHIFERKTGLPVHLTGRLAGQYSKPRSKLLEKLPDGRHVHAFRGHNINGEGIHDREPDPQRLLQGYLHALATLHLVYETETVLSTGHEALHLSLEAAMTKGNYNKSATFLWIGERTRQLDGAHIEYLRGLRNPIGVKIGPSTSASEVLKILAKLCGSRPDEEGRVTLITRFGAEKVGAVLPSIIEAVKKSTFRPVWMCDPCHGNTFTNKDGIKTRKTATMLSEVAQTIRILSKFGVALGGLHLEQTGEHVTECLGPHLSAVGELDKNYKSLCDPRLSSFQAEWFVERVAGLVVEIRVPQVETKAFKEHPGTPTRRLVTRIIHKFLNSLIWFRSDFGSLAGYVHVATTMWQSSIGKRSFKTKEI